MHYLKYSQKLPLSAEECWSYFSKPSNLKVITPEHLNFEMTSPFEADQMYAGQIFTYKIRPFLNIPLEWVTEITHVQAPNYFIDEQRFGPYKFWWHEHRFNPIPKGVEMIDLVYYKLPYGFLGELLHRLKIKRDIQSIFAFRAEKLEKLFGPVTD